VALSVIATVADEPHRRFRRVKDFGFWSGLLSEMKQQRPDTALHDLDHRFYADAKGAVS
jgi:hypothetical protein